MRAIAETGHRLVAALDPNDSVGVLDQHFPDAHFFVEFERFDRHIDKLRRKGAPISFVSVCSPNYLHDSHIRFALRNGADVICEKPVVLNPWNIDALAALEDETGKRVFNVLQLRLHPAIRALRERYKVALAGPKHEVDLAYITSRGRWYHVSWKGDAQKSGGIATNIGVHFFDMLQWVFGRVLDCSVHMATPETAAGHLELERANVRWFMSIDQSTLPPEVQAKRQRTYRSITVDGEAVEFSDGFTDLHTETYRDILAGGGYRLSDARPAIELVHRIRHAPVLAERHSAHPLLRE
ncbi:MAG: UDP-N-acetyl-2-amino-2-deoxyglucuronate dehydrogenase [Myxococcaceae bacterium]|nr:UDP-N-acetyl-2-amino-2-deoxyglucuronate dehydrogenase [Myxococcaceae bacterium]